MVTTPGSLPDAEITIRTLVTDAGGRWREPVLQDGAYELGVAAVGFETMLRKGIHLATTEPKSTASSTKLPGFVSSSLSFKNLDSRQN